MKFTTIDPYLWNLIIFVIACFALIILFLLIITLSRLRSSHQERQFRKQDKKWENHFLPYLAGDQTLEETIPHFKKKAGYHWLQRFFQPYLENLDGADFERTKALCRETGMIHYYQQRLKRGTLSSKATAARILGSIRCKLSIPDRLKLLQSKNPVVIQAVAQGLAVSGELETFRPVTKTLLNNTYFTYEGSTEILAAYGREICATIVTILEEIYEKSAQVEDGPGRQKPQETLHVDHIPLNIYVSTMIDLLGHYRYREALPLLNRFLEIADEEITVHILKTFVRTGEVPENYRAVPLLNHSYWVVRSFAAQTCRIKKDPGIAPELEKLLGDSYWWVRYHSALALLDLGKVGYNMLKRRAAEPSGQAADISRYIIERRVTA